VTALLLVALDEGQGVNGYARAAGIHRAMMSRNLHALGDRARNGGPGLGLVTISPDPAAPIKRQVFLTTEGRALVKDVVRALLGTIQATQASS
jgi:DNA-binding MarR family transcriptional regulator